MQLTAQKDSPETAVRPRRSVRLRLLATGLLILLLVIALFCWRPWQQRIHIVTSSNPKDGASMVWVPAGNFRMGDAISSEDIRTAFREDGWQGGLDMLIKFMRGKPYSYNAPLHTVYLDGYWIYTYEVTVAQYRRFCMATKRDMKPAPGGGWQDTQPITYISWDEVSAYAKWASAALPSEAQWEKAARGTDMRVYPWGNIWDDSKCCNSGGKTSLVGSKPADISPYGCRDMAGNAREWCVDWYAPYPSTLTRNPTGPPAGTRRVLRGGSWDYNYNGIGNRSAGRSGYNPGNSGNWYNYYGFRCASVSPGR